jgi:hypothetical protein
LARLIDLLLRRPDPGRLLAKAFGGAILSNPSD